MKSRLSKYASPWLLAAPLLIAIVLLPGCDQDTYSENIKYPLRRDPVIRDQKKEKEFNEPDPPGMLPLMTFNDIYKKNHFLYPEREEIEKKEMLRDMECMTPEDKEKVKAFLDEAFGRPGKPTVTLNPKDKELQGWIAELQLDSNSLEKGSHYFRLHCLHCHGLTGDGRGPSGKWLNPHPRDYRQGLFKFQSVNQALDGKIRPPRREDLYRTIHEGIDGTSMPAFNLLSEKDKNYLVSYVIHLSIRGQVEHDTVLEFKYDDGKDELYWATKGGIPKFMGDRAREIVASWHTSGQDWHPLDKGKKDLKMAIQPGPYTKVSGEALFDSIRKGHDLFLGKGGGTSCLSCHKDYGRQSAYKWDDWGTLGHKPRDFVKGQLRGGRRPLDIYYRIHSGINGSGMQGFGQQANGTGFTSDEIWHLVNFIRALPYPRMLPEDIQLQVYDQVAKKK